MNVMVFAEEWARGTLRDPLQHFRPRRTRQCTVCGYQGFFLSAGRRVEARCPNCSSKERDRTLALHFRRHGIAVAGKRVLHFSAERPFFRQWRHLPGYVAGDIKKSQVANAVVDITAIDFPDRHFDMIICQHVLEHVPADRKGMAECFRVLKPDGEAYFSVPLSAGREVTWEPPPDMPKKEVERICGWDHVRNYGFDFLDRLKAAGFHVRRIDFSPEEDARHRLNASPADNVYVARKGKA